MDLENQKRVKEFVEQYGAENIVVLLGAAEGEGAGLAAETVTNGDPTFAGPLAGVSLGLRVYHVCEPEVKAEFDEAVYDEQVGMMEMVLDVDDIVSEMTSIREQYCAFKDKRTHPARDGTPPSLSILYIKLYTTQGFYTPIHTKGDLTYEKCHPWSR